MNHGISPVILTLFLLVVASLFALASIRALISEKINTVGIIASVRVSLTIVAKSPATSLKA